MSKGTIRTKLSVEETAEEERPVLLSFPHNPPQQLRESRMQLWQHKTVKRRKLVEIDGGLMSYTGKWDPQHASNQDKFLVGIKEGDNIRLVETAGLFNMEQVAKKAEEYQPEEEILFKDESYFEKKHRLTSDFGTRKAKSKMNALKNNRVDEKAISTEKEMNMLLKQKVKTMKDEDEGAIKEAMMKAKREILPSFDPNADKPEKIYPQNMLISSEEQQSIDYKPLWKQLKKEEEIERGEYLWQTVDMVRELVQEDAAGECKHLKFRVRAVFYLQALAKFHKLRSPIFETSSDLAEKLGTTLPIARGLLDKFAEIQADQGKSENKFKYVKTKKCQDRLICYIIVTLFHIKNFKLDCNTLVNMLKVEEHKVENYMREAGASKKASEGLEEENIWQLKHAPKADVHHFPGKRP